MPVPFQPFSTTGGIVNSEATNPGWPMGLMIKVCQSRVFETYQLDAGILDDPLPYGGDACGRATMRDMDQRFE